MHMINISYKTKYSWVDIFKYFFSFLIVGIHVEPFAAVPLLDKGFGLLTRSAVPFFFMASAFFYFRKPVTGKGCFAYCRRILVLYLIWSLIYLPFAVGCQQLEPAEYLRRFLLGQYYHLWFLPACIVGVIAVSLMDRLIKSERLIALMGLLLWLFSMAMSTYYCVLSDVPAFAAIYNGAFVRIFGVRNGLFYGVPFMIMGRYFALNKPFPKSKKAFVGAAVSFAALAAEALLAVNCLHASQTIMWLSMLPLSFFIFSFVLNLRPVSRSTLSIRKTSTLVYLIHPLFIPLFAFLKNGVLIYIAVFAAASLISLLICRLSLKKHFTWLKYIQ